MTNHADVKNVAFHRWIVDFFRENVAKYIDMG